MATLFWRTLQCDGLFNFCISVNTEWRELLLLLLLLLWRRLRPRCTTTEAEVWTPVAESKRWTHHFGNVEAESIETSTSSYFYDHHNAHKWQRNLYVCLQIYLSSLYLCGDCCIEGRLLGRKTHQDTNMDMLYLVSLSWSYKLYSYCVTEWCDRNQYSHGSTSKLCGEDESSKPDAMD